MATTKSIQTSDVEAPQVLKTFGVKKNHYSQFCFCSSCKARRSEYMEEQEKHVERLKANEIYKEVYTSLKDISEDEIRSSVITAFTKDWPIRYFERFQKWFVRRCEKQTDVKDRTFDLWKVIAYDSCMHHLMNWDNGLKKALLKDKLIQKQVNAQRRYRYKQKRFNQRSAQNGKHPHQEEQIQDKDFKMGVKMLNATVDPKTCQLKYKSTEDIATTDLNKLVEDNSDKDVTLCGDTDQKRELMTEQGDTGQTSNDLEQTAQVSSTSNITFVDERPVDATQLHTKGIVNSRDVSNDIAENDWSIYKVLTREYPISDIEWKVTSALNTPIYEAGLPKAIVDVESSMITRQLSFFSFLRSGIKIRVQLNGTKFHCGRLIVFFVPLTWNDDKKLNVFSITCFPHFFLDASVSNSGEIEIPFCHLMTYFSQEAGTCQRDQVNSLGRLVIQPFNVLQAADQSSQSLYGTVYMSLMDPYVHLPTHSIITFSYGDGYMQGLEGLLKKGAGELVNTGLGIADKFTGGLVTGAGDALCNLLGICDKPTDPVSAAPILNRTVAPFCHGAGLDRSVRLGLSPVGLTDTEPSLVGAVDTDFNLLTLCKMPCLLQRIEWNDTQTTGNKLFDMLVTPTYLSKDQRVVNTTGRFVDYYPTMLAYVSRAFCLWRGTLKVKIQVIATQFHSGRLALVFDPHGTNKNNLMDFDLNKSHNIVIMDLQEKQELVVDLPYFAVKPWLRCDRFRSNVNLVDGDGVVNPSFLDCDSMGVFRIFVLNSLVKPNNVTSKVDINVFFYAGDNFELSVPNPVAPLSVRAGITDISYYNWPRYPWCSQGTNAVCDVYDQVFAMWNTGVSLFQQKVITAGDKWYQPTIAIQNSDAINFADKCRKLKRWYDDIQPKTEPCAVLVDSLPNYSADMMEEQGVQSYTTTRESEGGSVLTTDGNNKSDVAPKTISENAMNLQTVLRRFYPVYVSPVMYNSNDFTIITVPVTPSLIVDVNSDARGAVYQQHKYGVHNIAWFARLYNYNRGSLRYKILFNVDNSDVYCWHNPIDCHNWSVMSGFQYEHVQEQTAFATEVAVTRVQQGIEVEVPFYSTFNQLLHSHFENRLPSLWAQNGTLFIALRNLSKSFSFSVYMSTGDDFLLNVLRAPPIVHEPGLYPYTDRGDFNEGKFPEIQKALTNTSAGTQIPGSYAYDRWYEGAYKYCEYVPGENATSKTEEDNASSKKEQDFSVTELKEENQQMEEQGLMQIIDDYNEVMDTVHEFKETNLQTKEFIKEIKEDVLPAVLGHAKVFHQDVKNTHDTIKQFIPALNEAFGDLKATEIKIGQAAENVGEAANVVASAGRYVEWFGETLCISGIWLNIVSLHQKFTYTGLVNIVIMLSSLFKVKAQQIITWLWSHAQKIYEDYRSKATYGTVATEQGLVEFIADYQQEFSFGLAAVATVVYCAMFGTMPTWEKVKEVIKSTVSKGTEQAGNISEFLKSVHFSNLGFKAINNAFEFFQDWIQRLIDWYLGKEAREVLLEREFKEKSTEIEKWIDEIAELEDEDFYNLALSDVDIHNRFYKLADQGNAFMKWLMHEGVSKNVSSVIRDTNRKLQSMIKRINEIRPAHGFRYAPFSVWFHGETSTGKSQMMHSITDLIREELNIPYYNSMYAVPTTDKYLSGYNGQAIVEWDDILQNTNQDELVGQYIQWCSNADCKINMAELADKGKHFTSKAIIATSNCSYINVNVVRDMAAFRRRRNVMVGVQFSEGWDAARMENTPFDPTFPQATFAILKNDKEETIQTRMNFEQVKEYIKEKFILWNKKQVELVDNYMEQHGSLRIPKGVILTTEEEEEFEDAPATLVVEQGTSYIVCNKDSSAVLTEEEEITADIFMEMFDELPEGEKLTLYQRFSLCKRKVVKKTSNLFNLLKKKFHLGVTEFKDKVKAIYEKYPNLIKTLGTLGLIVTTGVFLKTMWNMFATTLIPENAYENPVSMQPTKIIKAEDTYSNPTPKVGNKLVKAESSVYDTTTLKVPKRIVIAEGLEHGTYDPATIEMARNKIHPLLAFVGWHETDYQSSMQCLAIGGKIILTPHHFFRRAKDGDFFWFLRGNDKILVEFSSKRMQRIRDKDACLYFVGAQFDSRKKIVDCFIPEEKLSLISKSVPAVLVGTTPNGVLMEKACTAKGNVEMKYRGTDDNAPVYNQYGWSYDIDTINGECGSPLIATSKLLPPPSKIIGIHVAGFANKRGGFSIVLTQEMIKESLAVLIERFGEQVLGMSLPPQVIQDEQAFNEKCKVKPVGSFSYYGVMKDNMCPSQPMKTQLKPTPFHGECYPVVKAPAKLLPDKSGSPLLKALGKYGKLTIPFKLKHISAVKNSILNDLMELKSELPYEPVSLTTAVFGVSGIKYCEHLNFNSSPGWPYQCLPAARGKKGKKYLFDVDNASITDELLLRNITEREAAAKKGERFPSIWRDCLKDELRPLEKVIDGKTRLFTIAPVDYTILVRKYFLSFEQAFYQGHSNFFSAVGINPESFEWTTAYNRLRSYGMDTIAGDFSCFDGTLMPDLMYECGEIINEWYALNGDTSEENALVRRVLIDEMIHTYQLVQNCVYKTHQGNPSGNPLTVILNTMVNAFYMRLAWMEIMSEKNPLLMSMDSYSQNVIEEMYGDDNRLVVKRSVLEIFNQVTVTECLAKHGITYTDESKSGNIVPSRNLLETSFLKRSYRFDDEVGKEIILPVMNEDTITSLTNWYRDSDDLEGQLQMNQRAACYFAFFHGREYFNKFNMNFTNKLRENGIKPVSLTYDEYLDIFLSDIRGGTQNFRDLVDFGFD